jgi:hypothetical protein
MLQAVVLPGCRRKTKDLGNSEENTSHKSLDVIALGRE